MIDYHLHAKHWGVFIILALAVMIASIHPMELSSYLLHQLGTLLMWIALIILIKKIGLGFGSVTSYIIFLLIHVLGAHYLYSYVPYNEWFIQLSGIDLNQMMGWQRNMYDRLVHFAYGLLLYPLFLRLHQVWLPDLKPWIWFILVIESVMSTSLIYEWIEWLIAINLSPEAAENYNGQQGDIWDAHKDILLATLGAIMTGIIVLIKENYKNLLNRS